MDQIVAYDAKSLHALRKWPFKNDKNAGISISISSFDQDLLDKIWITQIYSGWTVNHTVAQ